ncbi:hypothetical protein [Nonomuraea angiospora]|uniref:hypothetical protein n=1 Tax=Nonomuraea angiospora TaxID=46172 RepID=UPI0029A17D68|nr:hypothetical protein [Nonomuraea angiospora]MDX3101751.1 hypothetical protein [Nonomuraea angiospora]
MGRPYMAPINVAAHTAQLDYFELLAGTTPNRPLLLHGFELGQSSEFGDAQEEELVLVLKRVTGSPTSGSGGGTSTFQPLNPNDPAAGATLETGNTTKLTGGTSVELARFSWNVRSSLLYLPTPELRITLDAGTRLVLEEVTTPADSITGPIGWISIEEIM